MTTMKDSGVQWIGKIPESWKVDNLKTVLVERNESNNPVKTDFILSLTNDRGVIPYSDKGEHGNKSKEDLTGYKLAYPGDIVINSMNVIIGSVGLSNYYGAVSPVYYMLRPRNTKDDVRFYNYLFQTKELQNKLKGYGNGILEIRMRIPMSKLNTVEIPITSSERQKYIADFLDKKCEQIDKLIEIQEKEIEKLKEYRTSVITKSVTKGIKQNNHFKESELQWIKQIPVEWSIRKIKNIVMLVTGSTPSTTNDKYFDGDVNWFTPGDFQEFEISNSSRKLTMEAIEAGYKPYPKFSTLIIGIGGTAGKIAYMLEEGYSNQQITALIPIDVEKKYLFYLMSSLSLYIKENAHYTTLPIINNSYLGNIKVVIPNREEQIDIIKYLDNECVQIKNLINIKQNKIDQLKEYKKSLIYEYVTGKKQVND